MLHDEGLAYAEKMREAGVEVTVADYARMIHGFVMFPKFAVRARDAYEEIAGFVKAV